MYRVVRPMLAALAGAAMVGAFAPLGWWPLTLAGLAVLFALWLGVSPGTAFRRGYLFGLAYFGLGVSWVYNSIYEFGSAPPVLAGAITLAFVLFLSLYPALSGWIANRWFPRSAPVMAAVVYPATWVLMEWVRGWLITGFPWLQVGEVAIDTPLAGIVPILGVLGASWALATTAGLAVATLRVRPALRWGCAAAIAALWVAGWGAGRVQWTEPAAEPLRASLIQGNVAQDVKWEADALEPTKALYRRLTEAHWDSDLILWPETAVPLFYSQAAWTYFTPIAREARAHGTVLVTGIFARDPGTGAVYNSLVRLGETPEFYHKRHLVPFGEYLPLRGLLSWMSGLLVIPMSDLSSGAGRPLLHAGDLVLGASICYEDAYGDEVVDALPEAQMLINVSNDAWFGDSLAPHQHLQIARLRALETGRYLLRATNTGISAIMDDRGRIVARAPQFETRVLTAEVTPMTGLTPFGRWANWAIVVLLAFVLLIIGRFTAAGPRGDVAG